MNNLPNNITNELIVAFLNGETTNEESRMIQVWIESSDENRRYVEDLKIIWAEADKLNPTPVDVNVDAAWNKLSSRIEESNENVFPIAGQKSQANLFYKTLLKIAAVLIPVLFIAYLFFFQKNDIKQLVIVTTDTTQQKQLTDGSIIKINSNSKLTYPEKFAKNIREVNLEGEAYFEVAPDKKKPFVIHSNNADIKVVGTSFNVKAYKNAENIEVFVKTGKVLLYGIDELTGDTSLVELVAGNKGIYNHKTKKAYKEELMNENDLFWITKTLVFNKTELSDVVETLNENYNVNIELKNKKLNNLRLSATFNNQTIESIIDVIATSFDLKVTKTKSTYEIDGEGN
jgi:transmembrane sensor